MPWIQTTTLSLALLLPATAQIRPLTRLGVQYRILESTPSQVRLVWAGASGKPLRTFPAALKHLQSRNLQPIALMNGGIFEPGGIPSGLLVQDGRQLRPINGRDGKGNFFLRPNGVFLVAAGRAAVIDSTAYPPKDLPILHAVQSGPLLLHHGHTHPAFRAKSTSRLLRNGVGVTKDGKNVIFAITDFHSPQLPNLHEFADLFRHLGCSDALFLDGDLSQLRAGKEMRKPSNRFGTIIAIIGKKPESPTQESSSTSPENTRRHVRPEADETSDPSSRS